MSESYHEALRYVRNNIDTEVTLIHLAEEAAELACAALHLVRSVNGKDPTPKSRDAALSCLYEEVGDVLNTLDALDIGEEDEVLRSREIKMVRWSARLAAMEDDIDE